MQRDRIDKNSSTDMIVEKMESKKKTKSISEIKNPTKRKEVETDPKHDDQSFFSRQHAYKHISSKNTLLHFHDPPFPRVISPPALRPTNFKLGIKLRKSIHEGSK